MQVKYGTGRSFRQSIFNKTQSKVTFKLTGRIGDVIRDNKGRIIGAQITRFEAVHVEPKEDNRSYFTVPAGYYYAFIPHNTRNGECYGSSQEARLYTDRFERDAAIAEYISRSEAKYQKQYGGQLTMNGLQECGQQIAAVLGVRFDGIQQPDYMQFTEPQTGSTFYGVSLEDARDCLKALKQRFKVGREKTK